MFSVFEDSAFSGIYNLCAPHVITLTALAVVVDFIGGKLSMR